MADGEMMMKMSKGKSSGELVENFLFWLVCLTCLAMPLIFNPWGYNMFPQPRRLALNLGVLASFFLWLIWTIRAGRIMLPLKSPPFSLFFALIAWLLIASIFSVHAPTSFFGRFLRYQGWITWCCYLAIFLIALSLFGEERRAIALFRVATAIAALISFFALLQYAGAHVIKWSEQMDLGRPFSTLGNPSFLGGFLVLTIPLTLSLLLRGAERRLEVYLCILAFALQASALLLTQTRAAWAGILFSLAVLAPLAWRKFSGLNSGRKVGAISLLAVILIIIVLVFSFSPSYQDRLTSVAATGEGTSRGRLLVWGQTISLLRDNLILGTGADSFALSFPAYRTAEMERELGRRTIEDSPHNLFLELAVAGGIPGAALLVALLLALLLPAFARMARDLSSRGTQPESSGKSVRKKALDAESAEGTIIGGLTASVLGFVVFSTFSPSDISIVPLFWLLCGILGGMFPGKVKGKCYIMLKIPNVRRRDILAWMILPLGVVCLVLAAIPLGRSALADLKLRKGLELCAQGNYLEGDGYLASAAKLDGNQYYLTARGQNLLEAGWETRDVRKVKEALSLLEEGVAKNPLDEYSHLYLGDGLHDAGVWLDSAELLDKSEEEYRWVLNRDFNFYQAHLHLGNLLADQGRLEAAEEEWLIAVSLSLRPVEAYVNLARLSSVMNRKEEALDYYVKVLELEPDNQEAADFLEEAGS